MKVNSDSEQPAVWQHKQVCIGRKRLSERPGILSLE